MEIFPENCERCGKRLGNYTNPSVFNKDWICNKCLKREKQHPAYLKAKRFDDAQVEKFREYLKRDIEIRTEVFGLPDDLKGGSKPKKKKDRTLNDVLKAL